jgi:type I restriction enzyme S subunit
LKIELPAEVLDPKFLSYYLGLRQSVEWLERNAVGTTMLNLNTKILGRMPIPNLDIRTQKAIAEILSAYDDLIENNRRRMALLEESARLLYREWFVHLRFPGHEHVPVKEGVPEGWEKKKIGDASAFLSRGITPKYDDDAPGLVINQKCIRNNRVTLDLARRQSKEVPLARLIRRGDVLINSTGEGTLGRVAQLWIEIENCTVDSHVTIVRPAEGIPLGLFGAALCSMEETISQMGRGSTNQTELSKESVAELPILLPPNGLAQEFEEINSSLSSQISNLSNQIRQLSSARDLLLPRLMNGEIAV